jgi:hypothetical protein
MNPNTILELVNDRGEKELENGTIKNCQAVSGSLIYVALAKEEHQKFTKAMGLW